MICLKKIANYCGINPAVTKICVDDFAFRKRDTYGTVMVDLDTRKIIDIIDSRETKIC